ncbi:protein takeout-like [Zerene cesonia]|uniref:protein takeout-like n=1 Tax=Zerene cesonia TaxID=33412 RepID=UPI0018E4F392|nr:protein takeout-like [Zerene cesonia]
MGSILYLLVLSVLINCVYSTSVLSPCKQDDSRCLENSINAAIPTLFSANPELGVESSDPLNVGFIEGDLSIIKYKFNNAVVKGFKQCTVSNVKTDINALKFHLDVNCPWYELSGDYTISGRLIVLPVEGAGTFQMSSTKYKTIVDGELKKTQGADGKNYITIKNIKLKNEALGPIKFDFKNLFNGQKDLSDAVHKFANENWKEVANLVQDPVFYANFKKMVSNVNKYLKTIPLEDIILQ